MGDKPWVVNASPLILLGKTGQLGLLSGLCRSVAVPLAVAREVGARPDGRATLAAIAADPAFTMVPNEAPAPEILGWDLGAGETQVIANACLHDADRVVLDDLEARRCAKAMRLTVIGTLGVVGRAKASGLIDRAEPIVRRLRETGLYASDELVRRLLQEVGE